MGDRRQCRHNTSFYILILGLSSVEAYNVKTNEWFHVAPMNTRRSSVGVGVVGGKGSLRLIDLSQLCSRFAFLHKFRILSRPFLRISEVLLAK